MDCFEQKFKISELLVKKYTYWKLSVRPVQITLGCTVLSLIRDCTSLGELTAEETAELSHIFSEVELVLQENFNHNKINYLALMMLDDQVHFHIIPRYEVSRRFNGQCFDDSAWPRPIVNFSEGCSDMATLVKIKKLLAKAIS